MPETLDARIRARGPRPLGEVARIVDAVSRAVGQLHLRKRGHGGITPAAITWISGDGARAPRITVAPPRAAIVSLLAWQAPEHLVSSAPASPAADVWALGLVTYFALTGKLLWRSVAAELVDPVALVAEMHAPPSPSARALEQRIRLVRAEPLDAWMARCLAIDPVARFASATRAAHAFRALSAPSGPLDSALPSPRFVHSPVASSSKET